MFEEFLSGRPSKRKSRQYQLCHSSRYRIHGSFFAQPFCLRFSMTSAASITRSIWRCSTKDYRDEHWAKVCSISQRTSHGTTGMSCDTYRLKIARMCVFFAGKNSHTEKPSQTLCLLSADYILNITTCERPCNGAIRVTIQKLSLLSGISITFVVPLSTSLGNFS